MTRCLLKQSSPVTCSRTCVCQTEVFVMESSVQPTRGRGLEAPPPTRHRIAWWAVTAPLVVGSCSVSLSTCPLSYMCQHGRWVGHSSACHGGSWIMTSSCAVSHDHALFLAAATGCESTPHGPLLPTSSRGGAAGASRRGEQTPEAAASRRSRCNV